MPEYIEREKIVSIIKADIRQCEEDAEYSFGDEAYLQAVNSRKNGLHYILREIEHRPTADVVEVKHGKWETIHGVLTPGGDPLKRCPYCKSRESEHLDGVEHPSRWMFCPICGAKMDLKEGAEE